MSRLLDNKIKVWLVMLGVFALGCVTGASLDGVYRARSSEGRHRSHDRRERTSDLVERLRSDLGLSDEQAAGVRVILDETRAEHRRLRDETRPQYDRIREGGRARIRTLLTPEQQQIFDRQLAERDARNREHDKGER